MITGEDAEAEIRRRLELYDYIMHNRTLIEKALGYTRDNTSDFLEAEQLDNVLERMFGY